MNKLPESKRVQILSCLTEGTSVRGTARIVGTSKGAVLRSIAEIGPACERFHHWFVHDVKGVEGYGSIWTWTCVDPASKLLLSYVVGDRGLDACMRFVRDVA